MKNVLNKLSVFVAAVMLLTASPRQFNAETLFIDYDYEVSFYIAKYSETLNLKANDAGIFYIICCDKSMEKVTDSKLDNVLGKSFKIKNEEFNLEKFIKKHGFKIKITQNITDCKVFYLYSPKLQQFEIINGQKINLQVAIADDYTVAGCPLILGTF